MTFKNRNVLAGAIAISMLTTTASVWAQSTAAEMDAAPAKAMSKVELVAAFVKADANKDGKLSKQEAEGLPGLVAKFETIDTDGDKFVSSAEFDNAIE